MFVCAYVGLHVLFFNVILYNLSFIKIKLYVPKQGHIFVAFSYSS